MKIQNGFRVDAPRAQVWAHLTDIPTIASCLPGVVMRDETDGVYSGSVKSKVGPVTAEYRSSARFVELDEARGRVVLDASGRDSRTAGNVRLLVTAEISSVGKQTRVDLSTEVSGTGKVAQLGRGVLQTVSEKMLEQFVACLAVTLDQASGESGPASTRTATAEGALSTADEDALDLLDAAGGAVAKRLLPAALIALLIVGTLLYLL